MPEGFSGKATPELLIHCGDITERGTGLQWNDPNAPDQRSYLRTLRHLYTRIKPYAALGNHDSRKGENLREAFAGMYGGTYYSFDFKGVHFTVLDPYPEMNSAAPSLDKAQIDWLKADLTKLATGTPVIIVMHVLPMFDEAMDRTSRLDKASSEALAVAIAGRNVLAFLHGHWHARSLKDWNGIPIIAPADSPIIDRVRQRASGTWRDVPDDTRMVSGAMVGKRRLRPPFFSRDSSQQNKAALPLRPNLRRSH